MFVGREKELKKLNLMYQSDKFEFAIIYGRRRVGKTTLIKEFCKDKKAVYFAAREADGMINLTGFSNDLLQVTNPDMEVRLQINSWDDAFVHLASVSREERLIVVIDEYPYLAEGYRPISSILQNAIDHSFLDGKLFLILCGSSMSFMENQVLGYQSPLYGRRTAQFKIRPFTFFESLPFYPACTAEEKAIYYGITGGIPEYMTKIDPSLTVQENIISLYLSDSGHFFEEPSNLIKQELREPSTYNGIIGAIAQGASRLNEIATRTHMESNKCAKYLSSLISLDIVKKDYPVNEENGKKSIYLLNDQMFRFWYRFVFPNMSLIIAGKGEALYYNRIEPQLSQYMGLVFEDICRDYFFLDDVFENAPFFYSKVGRWWGNNPKLKRQEEIDVFASDSEHVLLGECKWTNLPVGEDVLQELLEQSKLFHQSKQTYYLFSKTGFQASLIEKTRNDRNIILVTFEDMIEN